MPRKNTIIPHTKKVRAKGRTYLYFITGQKTAAGKPIYVRLPDPSSPDFGTKYANCMANKTKRANAVQAKDFLTVPGLIDLYEKSHRFREELSEGSRRQYRIRLDQLRRLFPTAPANEMAKRDIVLILDKMADTPGAANLMHAVTSALYAWGREREHVTNNPCADIETFELGEHEPWPQNVLDAALASDNDRMRLCAHLLYYTALRIGDVRKLRWTDVRDDAIFVIPQKTAKKKKRTEPIRIPLHSKLKAELERHPRSFGTVLARPDCKPWSVETIRNELQDFALTMGAEVVPHGLRKNAVNSLLEAGCSVAETAAISDQTLAVVEHYAKKREQAKLGSAAILKWEGRG
jgi:integrase